jgi:hypothetical protein
MLLTEDFTKISSYRLEIEDLEIQLGHIPDYSEEQESEILTIDNTIQ